MPGGRSKWWAKACGRQYYGGLLNGIAVGLFVTYVLMGEGVVAYGNNLSRLAVIVLMTLLVIGGSLLVRSDAERKSKDPSNEVDA